MSLEAIQQRLPGPDERSCARGRWWLTAILVAGLGSACATTPAHEAGGPGPLSGTGATASEATGKRGPGHSSEKGAGSEAISQSGRGSAESEGLRFARVVLAEKGSRKLDAAQREAVARALARAEAEHGVSVIVSLAMIELESGFDPDARGPAGSIGLMQLQPATARAVARRAGLAWESERSLRDPETNARLGLAYLAELRGRFGTTDHALAAYNMGPRNLQRLLERRPLRRGPYLTKVYAKIDALRQEYGE